MQRLIIHADDFGETEQITLGICEGIDAGVITSASIMANMPATDFALARAPALASRASFGVHLTLCEGRPLTSAPSLVDAQGRFHSKRQLFLRSVSGRLRMSELEAEIEAQVDRVAAGGVRVSHLDGHKHLHQLPVVCSAVAKVARKRGVERVRLAAMRHIAGFASPSSAAREILALHAKRVFGRARLRSPRRLVDIRYCMDSKAIPDRWSQLGKDAEIVEIFCHPGTELADQEKPGTCRRAAELEFLLSPATRERLGSGGMQLVNYWSV